MSMEILELKDVKTIADPINEYPKEIRESGTPIVIDNGSYNCRVGWATSDNPLLVFKNLIAKPRKERGKKDGETQVGNDITNIEAVRFQMKTQFDRNVVTHFEVQEQILDYIFFHLGIDTEGSVNHPVVVTEAFLNPNYSRMLMSELLFECYGVPGVTYGVDMLFSYLQRYHSMVPGLIVSCGYQSTHIVPVLCGKADIKHARRIDVGGFHIINYLHRLLQLKYPAHFAAVTPSRAEELLHDHCFITDHYQEELDKWSDGDHYGDNVRRIQLPYTVPTLGVSAEQHKERKKELARRLIEINARKREEKLAEDEDQLNQLLAIQEMEEDGEEDELQKALKCFDLQNTDDLKKMITQIQVRIEKTKQKIAAANTADETVTEEPKAKIPKQIQIPKNEDEFKEWVSGIRKKRQEILDHRNARRQRRQDMARRRTVAAQERMRLISQLARKEKKDDDFGMRDEDWDVYKAINKEGGDTDSDEEAEKLLELEEVLRTHDPLFSGGNSGETAVAPGEAHQLHVGIERLRAPELLFQPSMMGSCQAGIAETIQYVLQAYDEPTATSIVKNVYLTGGCALIPGLTKRFVKELLEMRPFKSEFNIFCANDPLLDAWRGAKAFALSETFPQYVISRQEYLEKGGEYFKEHPASNLYSPSPVPLTVPDSMSSTPMTIQEDIEVDVI